MQNYASVVYSMYRIKKKKTFLAVLQYVPVLALSQLFELSELF